MNQEIHNYDKKLVKLITNSIFKDRITNIEELKYRAIQNELNEEDVESIFRILLYDDIIYKTDSPFGENIFVISDEKTFELEREDLI